MPNNLPVGFSGVILIGLPAVNVIVSHDPNLASDYSLRVTLECLQIGCADP